MMQNYRKMAGRLLLAASLLVGGLTAAQAAGPVGKVKIAEEQFGALSRR